MKSRRIDTILADQFGRLGSCIAKSPGMFITIPLMLTLMFGSGLQRFTYMSNVFYLFVPQDAKSVSDSNRLLEVFPENLSRHLRGSEVRFNYLVDVNLVPVIGLDALSREVWEEAVLLSQAISKISVYNEGITYTWNDLCVKFQGECVDNKFLDILNITSISGIDVLTNLSYPMMKDPRKEDTFYPLLAHLGNVTLKDGVVTSAAAMKLTFMVADEHRPKRKACEMWSTAVQHFLEKVELETADLAFYSHHDMEMFLVDNIQSSFEDNLFLIVALVTGFSVFNSMSIDWVRSKPLLGAGGLISIILAVLASFGLVMYLGFPWQAVNVMIIFLMLGVGMDGVFLILSAWSRSEVVGQDLVSRMSATYSDVAVSLTITSLTNVLSFLVGAVVPGFPCVHIFCVYAGVGLFFSYFWTITIFGAFLALSGRMELKNRHCLFFIKVKSKYSSSSWLYKLLLSGGSSQEDSSKSKEFKGEKLMLFFKYILAPCLNCTPIKLLILVSFGFYLAVSVLGISKLEEGLQVKRLVRDDSLAVPYFAAEDKYFRDHPYRIQVAIPQTIDFHNKTARHQVLSLIQELEDSEYISEKVQFRQSWLHEFLKVAEENFLLFNITTKNKFMQSLKVFMEEVESLSISNDVSFNEAKDEVNASRFFLQTDRIENEQVEMRMLNEIREIVSRYPFDVLVFNPKFFLIDQYIEVFYNTVICGVLCCVIMTVVIFVFLPSRTCVIWVILTILSVEVGMVGLCSFLRINLDVISMIVLIMGVGFSVDFSAHVSYHYLSAVDLAPEPRLARCLHALGPPILNGAVTTVLGVLPLMRHPSYIIKTFTTMVCLVILLGLVHSLFLLPVLLTIFGPGSCAGQKTKIVQDNGGGDGKISLRQQADSDNSFYCSTMQAFKRSDRVCSLQKSNEAGVQDNCSEIQGSDACNNNEVFGLDNPAFIPNEIANKL